MPRPVAPHPVSTVAATISRIQPQPHGASGGRPELRTTDRSFRDHLVRAAQGLTEGEHAVEAALQGIARGRPMSPEQLVALQATVYRHSLQVDVASRVLDKATGALRQTLQSQQ